MGLADFDFLPSVPQTFWGFPPFLYFTCKHRGSGVLYLYDLSIFVLLVGPYPEAGG